MENKPIGLRNVVQDRRCTTPFRILKDKRLTPGDLKVATALGSYIDKKGCCYPSQKTLADDTGLSRMSVSRSIKRLCEYGYIIIHPKFRPDGSKTVNEYKMVFEMEVESSEASPNVTPHVTELLHGCTDVTGDVTSVCYNKELPIRTKKREITEVISTKEKSCVPYEEVEVQHVATWATENLPSSVRLEWELSRYKDYWKSSHKKPPRDGVAAFRNWLRNAIEFRTRKPAIPSKTDRLTTRHKNFREQDYYANTEGFIVPDYSAAN